MREGGAVVSGSPSTPAARPAVAPCQMQQAYERAVQRLLAERNAAGHWEGRLSSSSLATAIAVVALTKHDPAGHAERIRRGLGFIAGDINGDGGWGDSPESPSNLTATVLCWCALAGAGRRDVEERAGARLRQLAGGLDPARLRAAIEKRYGDDRTFAAPILTMCALAGRLGDNPWPHVFQLPFELALMPNQFFKWLNMTVVSYALPALIAIGLVRHTHAPPAGPLRWLRDWATPRLLPIVERMQPSNGGFEEATPLTAFVTMSLVAAGYGDSLTVRRAVDFLEKSQRADGSWPIDTNLATWVTTLSINALPEEAPLDREHLRAWLLGQQQNEQHPLTFGAPGGWGWSDLPGSMPDADDTSGVLLALWRLGGTRSVASKTQERPRQSVALQEAEAAARGIRWLLDLQNRDGGIPTFSRGWGKLPFDRSCPDITAHALRAFDVWRDVMTASLQREMDRAVRGMVRYLHESQRKDGSWVPLWFGNQYTSAEENPTYGTAQVVIALRDLRDAPTDLIESGCRWLQNAQNADGGWGGGPGAPSSFEETALAICALHGRGEPVVRPSGLAATAADQPAARPYLDRGAQWLVERLGPNGECEPVPIGLYFAKLWYSERLYGLIHAVAALREVLGR